VTRETGKAKGLLTCTLLLVGMLTLKVQLVMAHSSPPPKFENLIVTSPLLEPQAWKFAEWKNLTGVSTSVLNTTWIYDHYSGVDNPERIRNCIKDFVSAYGISYVTIFGDADQVPVRYAYVPDPDAQQTYVPTDLYYADLNYTWDDNRDGLYADKRYDTVDGIPDVYIGRLPASSTAEAEAVVSKHIAYWSEVNKTSATWLNRVVLAAGTGVWGTGSMGTAPTALKDWISSIIRNRTVVKLYESNGNLSAYSLRSEIDKGCAFLNFAGHGYYSFWLLYGNTRYRTEDVKLLANGAKLPVVTTMAGFTARFDDQDCIGEWFVLNPQGGSIAYFGSTRVTWCYLNEAVVYRLMGEMDWRIYEAYYEGYTRLGQMWGQAVTRYIRNHIPAFSNETWNKEQETVMAFILLGDPTLTIPEGSLPDITPPAIAIFSPQNTTYATSSVPLTFTVNEPVSWMGYSLDGQPNATVTGNTTLTGLSTGAHRITVYANDTSGNMGASDPVHFTVAPPPPPAVGGVVVPVNKLGLLAPWILGLGIVSTAVMVVLVRRRKRR